MPPSSPLPNDKRESLLASDDIQRWYDSAAEGYRIGLQSRGEFSMGAEAGSVLITKADGSEWMNFGDYRFFLPNWNCSWTTPDQWNDPLIVSEDGEYLALDWLFFHVHGDKVPVVVHLPSRSFSLVEPRRILGIKGLSTSSGHPILTCVETRWIRAGKSEQTDREFPVRSPMQPIEEFYELDPFTIDATVFESRDGQYVATTLREYQENERRKLRKSGGRCLLAAALVFVAGLLYAIVKILE